MTFQDARASKCSSCTIKEDRSNYWSPQLYVNFKNGSFAPVPTVGDATDTSGGMTVYYLQRRGDNATEKLHGFPEGFRMLAGDPFKRSPSDDSATRAISFNCLGANKPETNNIPNYPCPGGLRAQVFFPACWNGKDLDTPDHKSHMSYPVGREYNTGGCPKEFPVHMISLFYEVLYDTAPFASEWNGDKHPFVFANGDATGYGSHTVHSRRVQRMPTPQRRGRKDKRCARCAARLQSSNEWSRTRLADDLQGWRDVRH
jgi:hypothetical protein